MNGHNRKVHGMVDTVQKIAGFMEPLSPLDSSQIRENIKKLPKKTQRAIADVIGKASKKTSRGRFGSKKKKHIPKSTKK